MLVVFLLIAHYPLLTAHYSLSTTYQHLDHMALESLDPQAENLRPLRPFLEVNTVVNLAIKQLVVMWSYCLDIMTQTFLWCLLIFHLPSIHINYQPIICNMQQPTTFLQVAPLRVLGCLVDIKTEVVRYLDRNFYHLTTIALHDWRTYSDMRSLAADKLGDSNLFLAVLVICFLPYY